MRSLSRRITIALLVSAVLLAGAKWSTNNRPFEDRVTRVAVREGGMCPLSSRAIEEVPLVFANICGKHGPEAYFAALKHPEIAPKIFETFGDIEEFQRDIKTFGSDVIPVVNNFYLTG